MENTWFGGETVVEFPKGKVRVFNEMISVGIEIADQYYLKVGTSAPMGDPDPYLWVYILSKLKPRSV